MGWEGEEISTCLRGREVRIQLRSRGKRETKLVSVVVPNLWRKSDLLKYVRQEHPNESVKIVEWETLDWEQRLWIANPEGFSNYLRATPSKLTE